MNENIKEAYRNMVESISTPVSFQNSGGDFGSANPNAPIGAMSSDMNHFVWAVAKKSNPKM